MAKIAKVAHVETREVTSTESTLYAHPVGTLSLSLDCSVIFGVSSSVFFSVRRIQSTSRLSQVACPLYSRVRVHLIA